MLSLAKTVEPIESSHKYDTLTHQAQTINTHRSLHMGSPNCPKSQDFLYAQYLYSKIDRPSFTIGVGGPILFCEVDWQQSDVTPSLIGWWWYWAFVVTDKPSISAILHCVHEKTITLDNVRYKCQIWTHPNQIACAWLWIYLRQNCQTS